MQDLPFHSANSECQSSVVLPSTYVSTFRYLNAEAASSAIYHTSIQLSDPGLLNFQLSQHRDALMPPYQLF